jgi:hypothetical protein
VTGRIVLYNSWGAKPGGETSGGKGVNTNIKIALKDIQKTICLRERRKK